jgi:hypothetical protein
MQIIHGLVKRTNVRAGLVAQSLTIIGYDKSLARLDDIQQGYCRRWPRQDNTACDAAAGPNNAGSGECACDFGHVGGTSANGSGNFSRAGSGILVAVAQVNECSNRRFGGGSQHWLGRTLISQIVLIRIWKGYSSNGDSGYI